MRLAWLSRVSLLVETFGTGDTREAVQMVRRFDFRPASIIEQLQLLRPIYRNDHELRTFRQAWPAVGKLEKTNHMH